MIGRIRQTTVAARAQVVRDMLAALDLLPLGSPDEFAADPHMMAAGESYLRRALEALIDLGRHVLAKGFGLVVPEYATVAGELAARGVLAPEHAERLRLMARYRNRMVHFYDEITPTELYGVLALHRGDLETILAAILGWLADHPEASATEL